MNHRRDPYLTNHSRQRAMMTDLKILQFEEVLERQERSVKKLREESRGDVIPVVSLHRRSREPTVVEPLDMDEGVEMAPRMEPKPYIPLSKQQTEPGLTREELRQWQYLQSMEYQRYLEEILCSAGDEKALVQKIRALRSNSIYLSKLKTVDEDRSYQEPIKPMFYHPRTAPIMDQLANCSKITERQVYFQQAINCRPYLEKNSMLDHIHEDQEEPQQEQNDDLMGYPQREQRQNIRIQQDEEQDIPMTPHYYKKHEDNVKTVMRAKPLPDNNTLLASTKLNLTNGDRQREKKEFISRQLSKYDKENKNRKEVTPSKSPNYPHRNQNTPLQSKGNLPEKSYKKHILPVSSQFEQSRQFYKKDRMDVSATSLYNIDFKLDRPDHQQRSFARCTSSITLSTEKSISRSKSSTKIKMSVVTASGRPGR